ncbi:MAG TPA: pitrilysin family protein [Blastocatellia bacterium]|nr:pitrilysin family protein [Blastocatellia bacterium]
MKFNHSNQYMKSIWKTAAGAVVINILLTLVAFAQAAAPARISATANGSTTDFVTANGLKTIDRRVTGNEVVAVQVYFRGGARNISEKDAGVESLLFEVATEGTKNFSKSEINRELARMGTVIDGDSGYDYSVMEMRCVRQNFDRSWELLADTILNPVCDEKEVALVKDQIISALRQQNDNPENSVTLLSNNQLYASHPYFNSPVGTVESVRSLTAAAVKSHHAKLLQTARMLVVVVGNVSQDEIKSKVEASFGKLPRGDYKPEAPPVFSKASTTDFQIVERPVATNYIRGAFAAPPLESADYAPFSIAMNILQQLFFQEVRVKRNLTYGADATLLSNGANSAYISVTTQKPNEAIRVMFDQIDFMQRQVIREEGLKAIISGFLTNYYTKLESNDAQAGKLAEYELLGGGWRRDQTWIDEVDKVTPEDVNRVSKKYLKYFHFAVMGDKTQFDRTLFMSR